MKIQKQKKERAMGCQGFLNLCSKFKKRDDLERFFDLMLTMEEKKSLEGRYLVIKALEEGIHSQREIAEQHQLSISQITRGSNALKIVDPTFRNVLRKHLK